MAWELRLQPKSNRISFRQGLEVTKASCLIICLMMVYRPKLILSWLRKLMMLFIIPQILKITRAYAWIDDLRYYDIYPPLVELETGVFDIKGVRR